SDLAVKCGESGLGRDHRLPPQRGSPRVCRRRCRSSVECHCWQKDGAACGDEGKNFPQTSVLNVFADHDYNRSVITVVGPLSKLGDPVVSACTEALNLIDLRQHTGVHPCLGAVDLIPVYPLAKDVGLDECADVAETIARQLSDQFHHFSAFMFGAADRPQRRSLLQRRREFGWFTGRLPSPDDLLPDVGPLPNSRHGLTAIGASPYVLNCNVTIDTADIQVGQRIAAAVRASSIGGLPGVQSMALPNKGRIEIACNLLSLPEVYTASLEEVTDGLDRREIFYHCNQTGLPT
uniref:Zgc:153901 n=1 Tax=Eptatretus burgeri TaxID=7764 RepID=A0A8C4QE79_EPTBU